MPALTRQVSRSNSYSRRVRRRVSKGFRGSSSKIPRAISTRGTPDGYYEIPVRTLLKIYCSSTSGFIPCNQTTGQPGQVGYRGLGIYTALDNLTCMFGNGGFSATTVVSIPGYSEMSRVFDQVKIASMSLDVWFENGLRTNDVTSQVGMLDVYMTQDKDSATPPQDVAEIMQYAKVKRMPVWGGQTYKDTCKPYVREVFGSSGDEFSTVTSVGGSAPAGYINMAKPDVAHLGWKAAIDTNTYGDNTNTICNIMITQIRRYKNTK